MANNRGQATATGAMGSGDYDAQAAKRALVSDLYAEADARFWAQVGYKPGQKLDPKDPLDAKQIPVWKDIFNKLTAQAKRDQPGPDDPFWTFRHPVVQAAIADAQAATASTAQSLDSAVEARNENRPNAQAAHLDAAQASHEAAQVATTAAAQIQPKTASHAQAKRAANETQAFVMQGAVGVPVVKRGSDAAAVMQAHAAPGRLWAPPGLIDPSAWQGEPGGVQIALSEPFQVPGEPSSQPAGQPSGRPSGQPSSNAGAVDEIKKYPPYVSSSKPTSHTSEYVAIGAAILAAVGLTAWGVQSGTLGKSRRASPRARPARTLGRRFA